MSRFLDELAKVCRSTHDANTAASLLKYVTDGDESALEQASEQDQRLIPFGQVPPIVFSEVLGDLAKIAGQKESAG